MSARYTNRSLTGKRILDYGCGYGRIIRLLYYYTDPTHIFGVDAWDRSLALCKEAGMPGNFIKCSPTPSSIEASNIDFAFALSIFTHLSKEAAVAVLQAVRKTLRPGGLFVLTIRPIEFWAYAHKDSASQFEQQHKAGFAFRKQIEHYGDSSMPLEFFRKLPAWDMLSSERSLVDPYQIAVTLRLSN